MDAAQSGAAEVDAAQSGAAEVDAAQPEAATADPAQPEADTSDPENVALPPVPPEGLIEEFDEPDRSEPPAAPNPVVPIKPTRLKRIARRAVLPVAAALLAAFVGATGYLLVKEPGVSGDIGRFAGNPPVAPSDAEGDLAPFAVPADGNANPFGTKAAVLKGRPTRLKVKAIGLDTALETLKIGKDGELIPPKSFPKAGWYADGTLPGDTGPAVIAGHVDSKRGPAVFYKLRELTKGDRIEVVRGGQTVRFTVTSTAWYPKSDFPTNEVYGPTPDRQLRLITCGGVFDRSLRSYKDNLVVYAVAG